MIVGTISYNIISGTINHRLNNKSIGTTMGEAKFIRPNAGLRSNSRNIFQRSIITRICTGCFVKTPFHTATKEVALLTDACTNIHNIQIHYTSTIVIIIKYVVPNINIGIIPIIEHFCRNFKGVIPKIRPFTGIGFVEFHRFFLSIGILFHAIGATEGRCIKPCGFIIK